VTPHSPKLFDAKRTGGRPTIVKRKKNWRTSHSVYFGQ